MTAAAPSERTRVCRAPARAAYGREQIDAILDAGLVAHLGFEYEGQPYVIPTLHARVGDAVYIHGSAASRAIRVLATGVPACLTVTLIDGLVLARSAFNHSMNYRSAVVLGQAVPVEGLLERLRALQAFTDKLLPNRWDEVRPPSPQELNGTRVLAMQLDEASAKIRTGPPIDDPEDRLLPVWAGVLPLHLAAREPEVDVDVDIDVPVPAALTRWVESS